MQKQPSCENCVALKCQGEKSKVVANENGCDGRLMTNILITIIQVCSLISFAQTQHQEFIINILRRVSYFYIPWAYRKGLT